MKRALFAILAIVISAGLAVAGHQGEIAVQKCSTCHISNLVTEHGGFSGQACWKCHDSTDPLVIAVIEQGKQGALVSCGNCHGEATHIQKHGSYMSDWMDDWGVEPGTAALWTQATNFSIKDPATRQYQVCFKCHSYYSFGSLPGGVTSLIGPSGDKLTDQAMEFNPANKSAHPVQATLNNQTGSYSPKGLTASSSGGRMKSPWTNIGNQTMQCSDCHEKTTDGRPDAKFLLKGQGKYWPRNAGGLLWTLYDMKANRNNWQNDLFCANCHVLYKNGKFLNKVHDKGDHNDDYYPDIDSYPDGTRIPNSEKYQGSPCVMCHVAVPHGCKRSRLIAYTDDVDPRQYRNTVATGPDKAFAAYHNGLMGSMKGFKKSANPDNYDKKWCYVPKTENYRGQTAPRWGCTHHEESGAVYDP